MNTDERQHLFRSLRETFTRYFKDDSFKAWYCNKHPHIKKPLDKFEDLLDLINEDDEAILEFSIFLSQVTKDSEIKQHIHPKANNDAHFECFYLKYIPLLIDGTLTKELNLKDCWSIADQFFEQKLILKKNHEICKSQTSADECKREIFKSIKRGKPFWPFVFIESIKQKRIDISRKYLSAEYNLLEQINDDRYLHAETNQPDDFSFVSLESASTLSSDWNYMEDISDTKVSDFKIVVTKESSTLDYIIKSGALSKDETTLEPYENLEDSHMHLKDSHFSDTSDDDDESITNDGSIEELHLRKYQNELAEKALEYRNTIICAPTGSGKTKVAMHIILSHLQADHIKGSKKVVFLAKTVPLVMQQYNVIKRHLKEPFKIRFLIGGGEDSTKLHLILPDVDVVVLTPKILENHIDQGLMSLSDFTLLIIDECHHTCRGDPYNNLMLKYIQMKFSESKTVLPQVVGLTASIGIGNADEHDKAVENILRICGNLDADNISIVQRNEEELKKLVPVPSEMPSFQLIDHEQDVFVLKVISFFFDLEMKISEFCKTLNSSWLNRHLEQLNHILKRSSQQYGQWAVTIRNIAKTLPRCHSPERQLTAYNNALEINNLVLLKNAMEYLGKSLEKYFKNEKPTNVEKDCKKSFEALKQLTRTQPLKNNLNLDKLKEILKLCVKEDSRGIIFVRTRALAYSLFVWLNQQKDLGFKTAVFTGSSAPPEKGGMPPGVQTNVIEKFRTGKIQILVATSVAEEGLDIPECNVVIKYNHIGNEVTTLQIRGRCRKPGGVSILLGTNSVYEKELLNQRKTEMMSHAIQEIAQYSQKEMMDKNESYQKNILKEEEEKIKEKSVSKTCDQKQNFKMICQLCGKLEINSEDIRKVNGSHRVIVNREIWKSVRCCPIKMLNIGGAQKVGTIHCMSDPENETFCFSKLGSFMKFHGEFFIALAIENFVVNVEGSQPLAFYKKWKNVPYSIKDIADDDFIRYLAKKKI